MLILNQKKDLSIFLELKSSWDLVENWFQFLTRNPYTAEAADSAGTMVEEEFNEIDQVRETLGEAMARIKCADFLRSIRTSVQAKMQIGSV